MENTENFLKKYQNHPLVHPMVAPHATNTNTAEQLVRAKKLADKYGAKYTLHVSEMDYEMAYFKDTYNKTPVEFLRDLGVMDENTIAAHCIHLTDDDIDLFAKTGAKIAHCVAANHKVRQRSCPHIQRFKQRRNRGHRYRRPFIRQHIGFIYPNAYDPSCTENKISQPQYYEGG